MSEIPSEPTPPQAPQKRRAGAPKGNRNAFKHGRYSAEVLDLRRRIRAFLRRANAATAAANRMARAKTEDAREKARAEVHAAVLGEGGKSKTVEQLSCGMGARGGTPKIGPESRNNYLSPAPMAGPRDPAAPA